MKLKISHQRTHHAIERELPPGSEERRGFDDLCADGCQDARLYAHLLMVVDEATACRDVWIHHPRTKLSIYDLMSGSRKDESGGLTECREKVSCAELVKLPKDIERMAKQIRKIQGLFGRLYQTKNSESRDQFLKQKQQKWMSPDGLYAILPVLLQNVATDLENEFTWIDQRFGVKRYDSLRHQTLRLLKYVHSQTGNPHFGVLIDILSPLVERKAVDNRKLPKFLSDVDALSHFYSRAKKYGFRPRRANP
jgi:hypothetical protein